MNDTTLSAGPVVFTDSVLEDPLARSLSLAVCDLLAGYREVSRVLDSYDPPAEERAEVLMPLQQAALRAAAALRALPTIPLPRSAA